ncbi:hypothetical protein SSPO_065920 [Streptomyces antimycoticus]|uniref:Uncharacterized protein n=1 Tax=Streptomyces antimycoticus TaxID=68175 RepID=A0A499UPP9_9ACTN|nr:hypothetical protein SSPO_065920 [Streptomyces antimycoticus]
MANSTPAQTAEATTAPPNPHSQPLPPPPGPVGGGPGGMPIGPYPPPRGMDGIVGWAYVYGWCCGVWG